MACDFPSVPAAITVVSLKNQHPSKEHTDPLVPAFLGRRARSRKLLSRLVSPGGDPASLTDGRDTISSGPKGSAAKQF